MADVDPDQMVQVLTNLFTNAQQAMPEGGTLTIDLADDPDTLTIKVTDTGVGIPPEHMPNLFDPFFSTKPLGMGTGLGLAVTHGIVKMHKGQVTAESNHDPAAGPTWTTLTVSLPRREEKEASPMTGPSQVLRVAMVDDEVPLSSAVKRILRQIQGACRSGEC